MRVIHIPCYSNSDPIPVLEQSIDRLGGCASIGLLSTSQHLNRIGDVREFLESHGKSVSVAGQILGCRQDKALELDVDCYLYVGSGLFHPLGLALKTDKPVYVLNPISSVLDVVTEQQKRKWQAKKRANVKRAIESETYGLLVSTKEGQYRLKEALVLKDKLESKGKKAYIFAGDELTPNNLLPFKVDCFITTACPRMSQDEFHRPIINLEEFEEFIQYI